MDNQEEVKVEQTIETNQENNSISKENEINWKKFREQKEADRKARALAEENARKKAEEAEALKAALEAVVNNKSSNSSDAVDSDQVDEFDRKFEAKWAERERKLEQERQVREQQEATVRIKQTHPDFDTICSDENIDYLEHKYPEVYRAFKNAPDSAQKWSDLYGAVKRLIPNPDSNKDKAKAERNFNKPQSMSVGGATQTGDQAPSILDSKRRSDNWARMQRVIKGGR